MFFNILGGMNFHTGDAWICVAYLICVKPSCPVERPFGYTSLVLYALYVEVWISSIMILNNSTTRLTRMKDLNLPSSFYLFCGQGTNVAEELCGKLPRCLRIGSPRPFATISKNEKQPQTSWSLEWKTHFEFRCAGETFPYFFRKIDELSSLKPIATKSLGLKLGSLPFLLHLSFSPKNICCRFDVVGWAGKMGDVAEQIWIYS